MATLFWNSHKHDSFIQVFVLRDQALVNKLRVATFLPARSFVIVAFYISDETCLYVFIGISSLNLSSCTV